MSVPAQVPISGPYIANGSTTQFAYKFYLLFATDMQVYVGGKVQQLNTAYTVTGVGNSQGGNIVFTTAPANGLEVLIKRATPYIRQTSYADNGDLLASVVNDDFDRVWLALQEINASFTSSISKPVGGNWDAMGLRITNAADGTQPQDLATLNQLNSVNGSAGQSASAAASSEAAAKVSENNAAVSAKSTSDSATASANSQAAAKTSETNSATSAANAATSEKNAKTSETNAAASEKNAAASAVSAKSDADRAESANPDNQLKKANNLSDVPDIYQARKNLGLGSAAIKNTGNRGDFVPVLNVSNTWDAMQYCYNGYTVLAKANTSVGASTLTSRVAAGFDNADASFGMYCEKVWGGNVAGGLVNRADGQEKFWRFEQSGSALAVSGMWNNGSDERIKKDIVRIENPLEKMRQIKGVTWHRIDTGNFGIGFIAQDVEKVWPDAVSNTGYNLPMPDGSTVKNMKALSAGDIAAGLHHEAILALMDRIDDLEAKLADKAA